MGIVRRLLRARGGQTTGEYALIAGGVALGCIVAVLFLGDGIGGLFGSNAKRIPSGAFLPPVSGNVTFPESDADCANGGWRAYAQFRNEPQCHDYVASLTP
jgi:Flp pilus assembly pilin Flp